MSDQKPTLATLPTEVQLEILSNLSYLHLLRVSAVSKKFRNLLQDRSFDGALFRGNISNDSKGSTTPTAPHDYETILHPAFFALWEAGDPKIHNQFPNISISKTILPTSVLYQNATSPIVTKVILDSHLFRNLTVENQNGVKIIDILRGIRQKLEMVCPRKLEDFYDFSSKTAAMLYPNLHGNATRLADLMKMSKSMFICGYQY